MAKGKTAPVRKQAKPEIAPSATMGEAVLTVGDQSFTLVLDMEAIDRFETVTGTSLIDLLAKIRHPALMGSPKLGHLVDLTLVATLAHQGDKAPDRDTVLRWVTSEDGWRPAINRAIARAFPTEGEPTPAA